MKSKKASIASSQTGMVSIITTTTFVIIIALIVTSFAFLIRREQRQALDRQLSTQAFYAAESGINDAINKLNSPGSLADITDCAQTNLVGTQTLGGNRKYTCVLVQKQPRSLQYNIPKNTSKIIKVEAPNNITRIRLSWQATDGSSTFVSGSAFTLPQLGTEHNLSSTGLLRATIIPGEGDLKRSSLIRNSHNLFLYPLAGAVNTVTNHTLQPTPEANQGLFISGNCNSSNNSGTTPLFCNVDVSGGITGRKVYYLRVKPVYTDLNVVIQAFDVANAPMPLSGQQAVIDSTGQANDVLRRVQVRVPITDDYYFPEFALETVDDICKLLDINGNTVTDSCEY